MTQHIFNLEEAAIAYALAAEQIFGENANLLNAKPATVPIFVALLFQSLEISIKHAGVSSGLFTLSEVRKRRYKSGHDIKEIGHLAAIRLGSNSLDSIVTAMTYTNSNSRSVAFIQKMICGEDMNKTRESYASRDLGYGEVADGDFSIIQPIPEWIEAVKQTAFSLPTTIDILSQWKASESKAKHFVIWLQNK